MKNKENLLLVVSIIVFFLACVLFFTIVENAKENAKREQEQQEQLQKELQIKIKDRTTETELLYQSQSKQPTEAILDTSASVSTSIPDTNYPRTLTKRGGVYNFGTHKETWYNGQAWYRELCVEDANGFFRYFKDGIWYFVIATGEYDKGDIVDISMGKAIVLDCGCATGTFDVYANGYV